MLLCLVFGEHPRVLIVGRAYRAPQGTPVFPELQSIPKARGLLQRLAVFHHGIFRAAGGGGATPSIGRLNKERYSFSRRILLNLLRYVAERIRAGGAGIPAFFTATGAGTQIAEGKPTQIFDGRTYVMERGLRADLAIIHAWKADTEGNLIYRKTARNFNPIMATAAEMVVAEVEEVVDAGQIDPDHIITAGIFVNRIVPLATVEKRIEQRTVRKRF
jgi:hypothetical protein